MHEPVAVVALLWHLVLLGALVVRTVRRRSEVERTLCLDTATLVAVGFLAILAVHRHEAAYFDVALMLALLAFAATVGIGRFLDRAQDKNQDQ